MKKKVIDAFINHFERIGGTCKENEWRFPSFISSIVIAQIIHNTCFECGGLMKDGEAIVDHKYVYTDAGKELWKNSKFAEKIKVRKCTVCGHSHT